MELNYKSYGAGVPLVILHGLFGSLDNWHTLSRSFAARFHVLALDQRNHGLSPHNDEFNYRVMAEDLREFLDRAGIATTHLLGHSMGGKTAMHFALSYPQRVDRLIVVDIAPRAYAPHHREIFDALYALRPERFTSRKEAEKELAGMIADTGVRLFLLKNLTRNEAGGFRWKMNLDAIRRNYDEINSGLDDGRSFPAPTLFVRGARSNYIEDSDLPLIKRLFPRAEVETVSGSGHWVHADAPERFAEIVLEFLS